MSNKPFRPHAAHLRWPLRTHAARRFICRNCGTDWEVYEDFERHHSEPADTCPECQRKGQLTAEVRL